MSDLPPPDQADNDRVLAELREQLDRYAVGPPPAVPDPDPDMEPADADAQAVAHAIVLRQLSGQAKTRTELTRVLKRKNVPDEAAEAVLDRMQVVGLVDDGDFADAWVESRQQRKHLSVTALRHELRGKGVAADLVEHAVAGVDGEDEYTAAHTLASRKYERMRGLEHEVVRRRLSGVLARRGFTTSVITRVLGEVLGPR